MYVVPSFLGLTPEEVLVIMLLIPELVELLWSESSTVTSFVIGCCEWEFE